jgi:sugar phosphate isomerase/epimerase
MHDWPVGLSTGCYYDTSIFDCLEPIRESGFSILEICSARDHLDYHDLETVRRAASCLRESELQAYSFHAPFRSDIDISALDSGARRDARKEIIRAVDAAATLGVRYFVMHPGPERGGFPKAERLDRMDNAAEVLTHVAHHCHRAGIRLVLENMLPHLFAGHVENLLYILGALETTGVGICLDTGHAHLAGDASMIVEKLSGHLWMIHANDNGGKHDEHLPPGDGRIDWQTLLAQLDHIRFNGTFILELAGLKDRKAVLEGARRARAFLRDIALQLDRSA